ncbi:MAG: amino acid permease [Negativicutes bacterium]|nr:amino acid permease [Negativicutes bacterium]
MYGPTAAYMFGWMRTVVFAPATLAALGLYFGTFFTRTFGMDDQAITWVAFFVLLFLMIVNVLGARYSGYFQALATSVKMIPIAVLAVAGLTMGKTSILEPAVTEPVGGSLVTGLGLAVLATLFAYDGFTNVSYIAGEMKNPARIIPRATVLGVGVVIVAYLGVNIGLYRTFHNTEMLQLMRATSVQAALQLIGDLGARMINIGIMISIFGCMNGYLLTLARMPYVMGVNRQLPLSGWFARIHPRFATPVNSIIFIVVFSWLELGLDADWLTNFSILSLWGFYIMVFWGLFRLRRQQPGRVRPFRVPLYPLVPAVALTGGLAVFIATFVGDPVMSAASCGLTLIGLPVLWLVRRRQ